MNKTFSHIDNMMQQQKQMVASKKLLDINLRKKYLLDLKRYIQKNQNKIIQAVNADLGKDDFKAQFVEVEKIIAEIDLFLKNIITWSKPQKVATPLLFFPAKSYVYPQAYGQVLIIAPWNYPVNLGVIPLIGAFASGNCVILKPSELSAHTSKIIQEMIQAVFPSDMVGVVEGGPEEATYLLEQKFDLIFYTGSTRIGQVVMEKAAQHLTPVILELGGKCPTLVFTDQIEQAARRIVYSKFVNCGQTCIAPDYVLIEEKYKAPFVNAIQKWITVFWGDVQQSTEYGRVINLRHFQRLQGLLDSDCKILLGGETDEKTLFFPPTVVSCDATAKIMQEEIFGPLFPIVTVANLDEAITFVNLRDKPLACYAFVDATEQADVIIQSISAGAIVINEGLIQFANDHLPFGGIGKSGMGSYHGKHSFKAFTHAMPVIKSSYRFDNALRYPPFKKTGRWILKLVKWIG